MGSDLLTKVGANPVPLAPLDSLTEDPPTELSLDAVLDSAAESDRGEGEDLGPKYESATAPAPIISPAIAQGNTLEACEEKAALLIRVRFIVL